MAGTRGVAPEPENKKNEWILESNAVSDPALARLIEVVDDQSDTARWMRSHLGTFDSSDLEHLREASEVATKHENDLKGAERSAFEALRAQESEREHAERQRARARAAAAAAAAASSAAAARKPRLGAVVAVKRPAPGTDAAAPAAAAAPGEAAKRARPAEPPAAAAPAALGLLAAYSDSDS